MNFNKDINSQGKIVVFSESVTTDYLVQRLKMMVLKSVSIDGSNREKLKKFPQSEFDQNYEGLKRIIIIF